MKEAPLVVQWLALGVSAAGSTSLIPGQGTGQKKKNVFKKAHQETQRP